jgi:hypothetical protein
MMMMMISTPDSSCKLGNFTLPCVCVWRNRANSGNLTQCFLASVCLLSSVPRRSNAAPWFAGLQCGVNELRAARRKETLSSAKRRWRFLYRTTMAPRVSRQFLKRLIFVLMSALFTISSCKPTLPFSLPQSLQFSFPSFSTSFQQYIEKRQVDAMKSYR